MCDYLPKNTTAVCREEQGYKRERSVFVLYCMNLDD